MGGRLIRNWLLHPLLSKSSIENRLDKVNVFFNDSSLLRNAREILSNIRDIERLISRLGLGIGNARDIVALKESLKIIPDIKNLINGISILQNINDELFVFSDLISVVENAIVDEAPLSVRDGGIIKSGFNAELDALRSISTEGKTFIKELQEREIKRTGISSLKVKFNTVFGYYIEISKSNLSSVPFDYIRKQTLVNAERFITPELKEYEEKVLNAEGKIKEMEYEIFYKVRMEAVKEIARIQSTAKAIAYLDTVSTFAFNSVKNNYCKPEISEDLEIKILNGRHPVIELIGVHSKSSFTSISTPAPRLGLSKDFVPNDCELNEQKTFLLITGPNMGGKSTYLRQVALISLMAQIGSYVPAENAKMSVVDRIFTRVGAADNLVKGESTFMVEMQETSYILNHATEKSLIILDEIGRGTSTYDGVSIAWAVMEFIHDNIKAKTLFATHYHELINLGEKLDRACNLSVAVRENENEGVVFLYKITDGGIDKSYGIEVAKLAGLPVDIISRARGVLKELETKNGQKRTLQKPGISPEQLKICQ
ncbi:DNA mismatch repair protein MutS [Candidatus Peregrinibacteria bacterium]|nr:DNA mismatch repair protein MutS [Candidatus Peregrinibacteria bacterium]